MFHIDSTIQHLVDLSWFATYWYGIAKPNWYQSSKAWFLYVSLWPPLSQPWWWISMVIDHMSPCFYGSWKLLTLKFMIGICWNKKQMQPILWFSTWQPHFELDFPCDLFACWGWSRKFRMLQTMGKSCGKRTPRQLEDHRCQAEHHIPAEPLDIIVLGFCLSASMHWIALTHIEAQGFDELVKRAP